MKMKPGTRLLIALLGIACLSALWNFFQSSGKSESSLSFAAKAASAQKPEESQEASLASTNQIANQASTVIDQPGPHDGENKFDLNHLQLQSERQWQVKKDPFSGAIRTLSEGLYTPAGENIEQKCKTFLKNYAQSLFGVASGLLQQTKIEKSDRTRVVYQQTIEEHPVFGASLTLVFEGDSLVRVQSDLARFSGQLEPAPSLSFEHARTAYLQLQKSFAVSKPMPRTVASSPGPELILFPTQGRLVWAYQFYLSENNEQLGHESQWILLDAKSGNLIKKIGMTFN